MPRIDVPFRVNGQLITQITNMTLASGGQNYFYAVFELCNTWKKVGGLRATFERGDDRISVLLMPGKDDDHVECEIPWEMLTKSGEFRVGIYGGDRITTNLVDVKVLRGSYDGDNERLPTPPTPDYFGSHVHDERYFTKDETLDLIREGANDSIDNRLPTITRYDDGKFIRVRDGKYVLDNLPKYEGSYAITPSVEPQTMPTSQSYMEDDIVINEIPYYEVSNNANGKTVTIG